MKKNKEEMSATEYLLDKFAPEDPTVRVSIAIPESLKEELQDYVYFTNKTGMRDTKLTVSSLIREVMTEYLQNKKL